MASMLENGRWFVLRGKFYKPDLLTNEAKRVDVVSSGNNTTRVPEVLSKRDSLKWSHLLIHCCNKTHLMRGYIQVVL